MLAVGAKGEARERVSADNTAIRFGSGQVDVYGTPALLALLERACIAGGDHLLEPGQVTVGISATFKHLAATPVGMEVRATAELTAREGKKLVWKVEAYDDKEKVAEGVHERFVVQLEKFLARARAKA